jgi:hypothetical protein
VAVDHESQLGPAVAPGIGRWFSIGSALPDLLALDPATLWNVFLFEHRSRATVPWPNVSSFRSSSESTQRSEDRPSARHTESRTCLLSGNAIPSARGFSGNDLFFVSTKRITGQSMANDSSMHWLKCLESRRVRPLDVPLPIPPRRSGCRRQTDPGDLRDTGPLWLPTRSRQGALIQLRNER